MLGPKCKFCGEQHFGLCKKIREKKGKPPPAPVKPRPIKSAKGRKQ